MTFAVLFGQWQHLARCHSCRCRWRHVHFMQQRFSLSDPAMEEAFFDTPLYREFAPLSAFGCLPDESTILRFRHRLEKRGWLLKVGTAVDATLFPAPSSTKNKFRSNSGCICSEHNKSHGSGPGKAPNSMESIWAAYVLDQYGTV